MDSSEYGNPSLTDWTPWRVALGTVLITAGATGAAGGGIGGGGLYVPLLIIVIGFKTKEAVAVSQGCIVGAAIAHFIINVPKKHPVKNIPVIDYAALLVLEPMLLTGSLLGVMLNSMLPSVVILLILIVVLSLGAYKTGKRALKITKSERSQSLSIQELIPEEKLELNNIGIEEKKVAVKKKIPVEKKVDPNHATSSNTWRWIMWDKLGLVAGLWLIVCVGLIIRGSSIGDYSVAGILYCSSGFWGLTAGIPVLEVMLSTLFGKFEIDRAKKSGTGESISPKSALALSDYKEVVWNWPNVVRYMVYAFVCGALAGCLGIGGGLVLSPLLLELGFYPAVASGISGMAVLVTSTSALFAYGLARKVYWEFVLLLMPLTFLSTLAGKILIDRYAERTNQQSVIIWSVVVFLNLCLIMLATRGIIELVQYPSFEFSSLCDT